MEISNSSPECGRSVRQTVAMRINTKTLGLAAFLISSAGQCQNPDSEFPKSPEVHVDQRVTFRLLAPEAQTIEVQGSAVPDGQNLRRGDDGMWEVTVGPLVPNIYDYHFEVDGAHALDPHNRWFKSWRRSVNQFVVPGKPPRSWEIQHVPHGVLHHHTYHSELLQTEREIIVYTPPGYESLREDIPVLFLLHGSGDDATAWTTTGRAHVFADNMISEGRIVPQVIVMPYGHGHLPGVDMDAILDRDEWWRRNNEAVLTAFKREVIPFARTHYRIREDAAGRAVGGLSMGGKQALQLGLTMSNEFRYVLAYSPGAPENEEQALERFGDLRGEAVTPDLVWIACGRDDFLFDDNQFFHDWLMARGIRHEYHVTDGDHTWDVWRGYLEETLPLLFRE